MANEKDIPRYKMTDALPDPPADAAGKPAPERPGQSPHEPDQAELKQQNAEVNEGLDRDERLTQIGRGHQTHG